MKKKITISIPDACSEHWGQMKQTAAGRFCGSCQHTVTDFTGWTDAQLYRFFTTPHGKVCGRFTTTQLDRPITAPAVAPRKLAQWAGMLGLTLLGIQPVGTFAQQPATTQSPVPSTGPTPANGTFQGTTHNNNDARPLPDVAISLLRDNTLIYSATSDSTGHFSITGIAPGRYRLAATHDYLLSAHADVIIVHDSVTVFDIHLSSITIQPYDNLIRMGGPMVPQEELAPKFTLPQKVSTRKALRKAKRDN